MRKYGGGQKVGRGTYWNSRTGGITEVRDEGVLPGDPAAVHYRIPFFLLLLYVMVSGGVYVVLFPVIVSVTAVYLLGKRIFSGAFLQARRSVAFGWRPSEAYLAGNRKGNGKPEGKADGKSKDAGGKPAE